jgi:hypothetical protein
MPARSKPKVLLVRLRHRTKTHALGDRERFDLEGL